MTCFDLIFYFLCCLCTSLKAILCLSIFFVGLFSYTFVVVQEVVFGWFLFMSKEDKHHTWFDGSIIGIIHFYETLPCSYKSLKSMYIIWFESLIRERDKRSYHHDVFLDLGYTRTSLIGLLNIYVISLISPLSLKHTHK